MMLLTQVPGEVPSPRAGADLEDGDEPHVDLLAVPREVRRRLRRDGARVDYWTPRPSPVPQGRPHLPVACRL